MSLASLPHTLWHLYVDNLVHYQKGSWVDSIASTCRVLAFATIIPFILLTLLDVASYVIARTLGVIDETKASTSSELEHAELHKNQPTIVVDDPDVSLAAATPLPAEPSAEDVDGNLKLSGVDTFSPAPSQPGSPTLQRREFMQHQHAHYGLGPASPSPSLSMSLSMTSSFGSGSSLFADGGRAGGEARLRKGGDGDEGDGEGGGDRDGEGRSGATTPRDPSGHGSAGSSSSESSASSYAILDRDSGSEDAGVVLRRRTRKAGTGSGAEDGAA
ncbi:hypothetical protein C8Q76DRAFT_705203 [Earliella scabrosa]|nr:hypothetical protein C8Q76DRAFT_705203 [Earliella scabrosa]